MAKTPDRAKLSRLVNAYDRIEEESLGMGDPEFHEIEDQLFDAIVDSRYRAVIKNGNIYIPDPNGLPGVALYERTDPTPPCGCHGHDSLPSLGMLVRSRGGVRLLL